MSISENIANLRRGIADACREAGRDPGEITLVGASKMNDASRCREAVAAGIDALGENRAQELTEKWEMHAYDGVPLHFIGHLQRNKVRQVVGRAALIQSVSSEELLEEIEKRSAALNLRQQVLLEVNVGGEAAKSGFAPQAVEAAAEKALALPHVEVLGLMTIPPVGLAPGQNMPYFEKMYRLYIDINRNMFHNEMKYLSMGMSGDYADAIRCGSNMVRVGTAIFGARHYQI